MRTTRTIPDIELERLVEMAADGDAAAFGKLYDIHIDQVYRHIYYRVGNTGDAEDLTQQVFLKAWRAMGRFRKTSSPFAAWLMTISRNLLIDFYRARREHVPLDDDYDKASEEPGPLESAESEAERRELIGIIARLPDIQRQVLIMRIIEDHSFEEIAGIVSKSEGAVRVILHRALKSMKALMQERGGQL